MDVRSKCGEQTCQVRPNCGAVLLPKKRSGRTNDTAGRRRGEGTADAAHRRGGLQGEYNNGQKNDRGACISFHKRKRESRVEAGTHDSRTTRAQVSTLS